MSTNGNASPLQAYSSLSPQGRGILAALADRKRGGSEERLCPVCGGPLNLSRGQDGAPRLKCRGKRGPPGGIVEGGGRGWARAARARRAGATPAAPLTAAGRREGDPGAGAPRRQGGGGARRAAGADRPGGDGAR